MLRLRILDEIVDPSELHGRVADLAQALAANAPLAIQGMKHALNRIAAGKHIALIEGGRTAAIS